MTWDPVPLAVGGGAVMQVESLRQLVYNLMGGRDGEGVAGAGDAAVLQGAGGPSGAVRVMPGGVSVLNRGADTVTGGAQAYAARNPTEDVVAIVSTGAGTTRYDLVAVVIEDPQYAGQPAPASVANGPYVRTRVYQNVPATTTSLAQVAPGQTGLALARIAMPPSTVTVSTAQITDLRRLSNPKVRGYSRILDVAAVEGALTSAAYVTFPGAAAWSIYVPTWAQTMQLEAHVANLRVANDATDAGDWSGSARITLGTAVSGASTLRPAPPRASAEDGYSFVVAGELDVPADHRNTNKFLKVEALRSGASSGVTLRADYGTVVLAKVTFYESPNPGVWTT